MLVHTLCGKHQETREKNKDLFLIREHIRSETEDVKFHWWSQRNRSRVWRSKLESCSTLNRLVPQTERVTAPEGSVRRSLTEKPTNQPDATLNEGVSSVKCRTTSHSDHRNRTSNMIHHVLNADWGFWLHVWQLPPEKWRKSNQRAGSWGHWR